MDFSNRIKVSSLESIKSLLIGLKQSKAMKQLECTEILDYNILKAAVTFQREDLIKFLLENSCKVNQNTDTPLHIAARLGNIKYVKILLDKKASVTVVNEDNDSPLHVAFKNKHMEIVDLMLNAIKETSNYSNIKDKQDLTHLGIAYARSNKAVVHAFLTLASNAKKMTINHNSVSQDSKPITNVPSEKAKQEPPKSSSETEKFKKVEDSSDSDSSDSDDIRRGCILNKLPWYFQETSEFHIVCGEGHPDKVKRYLREGWDVNAQLKDLEWNGYAEDSTPLHCAVEEYNVTNAEILLKYGADAMLQDENQATPLHIACYINNPKEDDNMLHLIYKATKDKSVNLKDKNGMSFLHAAAALNDLETVKRYIDQGEDVNQQIGKDIHYGLSFFTPLHYAVSYRQQEMVEFLIKHGADVNRNSLPSNYKKSDSLDYDDTANSPLLVACEFGHQGIIELLLKNGAKGDALGGVFDDKSALHFLLEHVGEPKWAKVYAGDSENKEDLILNDYNRKLSLVHSCMGLLLEAGCDIDEEDRNGDTALHYACSTKVYNRISTQRLLQLGADINIENKKGQTPMEMRSLDWYCGNANDYMVLYHHVQELKALGLPVNPKNEEYCKKIMEKRNEWSKCGDWEFNGQLLSDEELAIRDKQRLEEVEKMKMVMLTKKVSLYDYAVFGSKSTRISGKNLKLKTVLNMIYTGTGYPVFGQRIWMEWEKDLQRKSLKRKNEDEIIEDGLAFKRSHV